MKQKQIAIIGWIILAIIIIGFGGFFLIKKTQSPVSIQNTKDEFTGTWHGGSTTKDGYTWFVDYTFNNGTYDMKTDSAFKDNGTYEIIKRFEDHVSIQIRKTSIPFNKTYDIYISLIDKDTIMIDGMKLYRKK